MTFQRYLDRVETNVLGIGQSRVLEYQGNLHENALARSFGLLCVEYPVLRARVRPDGKGNLLYVSRGHQPEFAVLDGDESVVQREISLPWDPSHGLTRLVLVRSKDRGFVVFRVDHAIVDGRSYFAMWSELWRIFTDIVNGADVSVKPGATLPRSPSDLLRHVVGAKAGAGLESTKASKPLTLCPALQRHITLSEVDTTRLIAAAHANNLTVHTLVAGVVLVVLRNQGTPTEPTPMVCGSPVDLRSRVSPAVGATEATIFNINHKSTITVPVNGDPVAVARDLKADLESLFSGNELQMTLDQSPPPRIETSLEPHLATVTVSNVGIIPDVALPAGITMTSFRVPNHPMTGTYPVYAGYTYGGQLNIRCVYPSDFFSNEQADQLVEQTTAKLCSVGASQAVL